jgi:hypothetical protein
MAPALVEAWAFDTGAEEVGALPAGAGVDCAGESDVLSHNRTATATSADCGIGDVTRGGEEKNRIIPLYAELDASERLGESLA